MSDPARTTRRKRPAEARLTPRAKTARAIRESVQRFRKIFDEGPLGMAFIGLDYRFIQVNRRLCEMLGYTEQELTALTFLQITHPEDIADDVRHAEQAFRGEIPFHNTQKRYLRKDGETMWVSLTASVIRDANGQPLYGLAMIEDITEIKQAEQRLIDSERRLAEAERLARLGSWEWDLTANRIYWSEELHRIYGAEPSALHPAFEFDFDAFLEHVHPDDRDVVRRTETGAVENGQPFDYYFRIVRPDGEVRILHARGEAATDEAGRPVRLIGSDLDVTEARTASEEITRLYAAEQARRREAEALREAMTTLTSSLEPAQVLDNILSGLERVVRCDSAGVFLLEDGRLRGVAGRGFSSPLWQARDALPSENELFREIQQSRRALLLADAQADPRFENWGATDYVRGWIGAPLITRDEVIGFLTVNSRQAGAFDDADAALAQTFADHAAVAIANARLFEQVRDSQRRLEQLAQQMISLQEEERRRVSRELHDEIGQALTSLLYTLASARAELPPELDALRHCAARVDQAMTLAEKMMADVRNLAHDLRPPALETVGLNLTLEDLCYSFSERTRLKTEYAGVEVTGLPGHITIALYRFLQEALTNVAKHSGARNVRVELSRRNGAVALSVEDDGRGFESDAALPEGIGLLGMRERLGLLGGKLAIESRPGQGTRLTAIVPWEN